jgi:hypothetical protein
MAISSIITRQATDLLVSAREYCNNDKNIDEAYVKIEVLKGTQKVLNELCGKEISDSSTRASTEEILKKVQTKLQRAEQLNAFLRSNNIIGIDPRVERIMKKIADQKQTSVSSSQTKAIHEKLKKWDAILKTCSLSSNEPTKQTAVSGLCSISEIRTELLHSKAGAIPDTEETTSSSSSSSSSSSALDAALFQDPVWVSSSPSSSSSSSSIPLRVKPRVDEDFIKLQHVTLVIKEGVLPKNDFEDLTQRKGIFSTNIFDRMCFHLYHIQDKETPNMVNRQVENWGFTAFIDQALATPTQRLRAAQRVQVEMLFEHIKRDISFGGGFENRAIDLYFKALEALKLDPNDCPKGQNNAAHALYKKLYENEKLYETSVEPRKPDKSWEDPYDENFQAHIPDEIKNKALEEVKQAFIAAWRIQ